MLLCAIREKSTTDSESFAEVSESDLIALALSPNGDETNENRLGSMASDLTLNSVSLVDADGVAGLCDTSMLTLNNIYDNERNFLRNR